VHFYWRIFEELKLIGETWGINDPGLKRNYEKWLDMNADAISACTMDTPVVHPGLLNMGNIPFIRN